MLKDMAIAALFFCLAVCAGEPCTLYKPADIVRAKRNLERYAWARAVPERWKRSVADLNTPFGFSIVWPGCIRGGCTTPITARLPIALPRKQPRNWDGIPEAGDSGKTSFAVPQAFTNTRTMLPCATAFGGPDVSPPAAGRA